MLVICLFSDSCDVNVRCLCRWTLVLGFPFEMSIDHILDTAVLSARTLFQFTALIRSSLTGSKTTSLKDLFSDIKLRNALWIIGPVDCEWHEGAEDVNRIKCTLHLAHAFKITTWSEAEGDKTKVPLLLQMFGWYHSGAR